MNCKNVTTVCGMLNDVSFILNDKYYETLNCSLISYLRATTGSSSKFSFLNPLKNNPTSTPKLSPKFLVVNAGKEFLLKSRNYWNIQLC